MKRLRQCTACKRYTLQEGHCGQATAGAHPAPFNPHDRYGEYRRKAKEKGDYP